jgi:nucleotide-binding universal stress UspA family protein
MFKHLLIPTDGSPLSESDVLKGLELARALGARVTALHVSPRCASSSGSRPYRSL